MAFADTARLAVQLDLKGNFAGQIRANQKLLTGFDKSVGGMGNRALKAGQQVGTGIKRGALIAAGAMGLLATQVGAGLSALVELEKATAQTNAVLKSTKGVAGQTAESVRNLSEKYEALNATVDDKVIQSAQNVLLTFTAVRKQAFEPALKAALDMSTALGTDLQGSVIQIGKALQDPIKGITALRRVGVNFSADQIKVIKRLVETGKTLEAQKLILAELNTEFGGSFLAQGNTTAGKVAKFQDSIEDLQKALATALLPTIGKVADGLTKFLADPAVVKGVEDLGKNIAGLFSDKNLATGAAFLRDAFETAKSVAPVVAAAAKTTFGFVQGAVGLFKSLPPQLQGLLVGGFAVNKLTGGLVTNIAGGIIGEVGKQFFQRGGTPANPLFVKDVGLPGGIAGAGAGAAGGLSAAAKVAGGIFGVVALAAFADTASPTINKFGTSIHDAIFGKGSGFAGTGIQLPSGNDLQWPFGNKNAPDWAKFSSSGSFNRISGVLHPVNPGDLGVRQTEARENRTGIVNGKVVVALDAIRQQLVTANHTLRTSKDPAAIAAAAIQASRSITKGAGSADTTARTLASLKTALKNVHDPKTRAALQQAIKAVERKTPGREFAQRQISKADAILKSNQSSARKIEDLKAIERALKDRGLPHAASLINAKIAEAKRAQTAAARATTEAIKDKDMSPTVNVTVPVTTNVTVRDIIRTSTRLYRYGNVPF